MPTTPQHQGVIRFVEEAVAGQFPANPDLLLFSKETVTVTVSLDKNSQESLDIGELDVHEHYSTKNVYGLGVEFHLYSGDAANRILDNFVDRNADGTPKVFSVEWIPNQDATTPRFYRGSGWRPSTIEFSLEEDNAVTVSIEFMAGTISDPVSVDPGVGTGSRETKADYDTALSNPTIVHFSTAAITLDTAVWAVILNSLTVTIDNGITARYSAGDADPVAAATSYGVRRISGSADISLDEGASEQWGKVSAFGAHTLEWPFGTAGGSPMLVLEGVRFPSIEVEQDADGELLEGGQDFVANGVDTTQTV